MPDLFLHHNRGVPKLRFTLRVDREIRFVQTKPFNSIMVDSANLDHYLITKGTCAKAAQLGRLRLTKYEGNWPRFALLWARLKEKLQWAK